MRALLRSTSVLAPLLLVALLPASPAAAAGPPAHAAARLTALGFCLGPVDAGGGVTIWLPTACVPTP